MTARIPTLHVVGDNIPQAHFRAMKAVWENGLAIRTEYDRKNSAGDYIDPPSRDARVLVEVLDPFAEPRFPPTSFCEIGTYIAEIMGAKDHFVLPVETLKEAMKGELASHQWPYTYHQRLFAHPDLDGSIVDQMAMAVERVAKTPHTRRAMATTSVPNLDAFLKEDVPCLREVQLRCPADEAGILSLNMTTSWRSRDLFKAWADNVVGLTFMQQVLAEQIQAVAHKPVKVGSYADFAMSLHIYGQDFKQVGGDAQRGLASFFDTFTEKSYLERAMTSDDAKELLVVPQLKELLAPAMIEQWKFGQKSIDLIRLLIDGLESNRWKA